MKLLTSAKPNPMHQQGPLAHQQGALGLKKCAKAYKRLLAAQIEGETFWELFGHLSGQFFLSFVTIYLSQKTQKHIKVS